MPVSCQITTHSNTLVGRSTLCVFHPIAMMGPDDSSVSHNCHNPYHSVSTNGSRNHNSRYLPLKGVMSTWFFLSGYPSTTLLRPDFVFSLSCMPHWCLSSNDLYIAQYVADNQGPRKPEGPVQNVCSLLKSFVVYLYVPRTIAFGKAM